MIVVLRQTVKEISQKIYNQMLKKLNRQKIQCSECKQFGFNIHSYYDHHFKIAGQSQKRNVVITQLICPHCGKTHAVLLCTMVPWSQITLEDTIRIIEAKNDEETRQLMYENEVITVEDVKRIRRVFRREWKERLKGFNINIDDDLSENCIKWHKRQFMQNHCGFCIAITQRHIGSP